jgi:hypothetical protein
LPALASAPAAIKPASDPNFSYDAVDGPEADGPKHADFRKPALPELSPPQAAAPQPKPATIVAPQIATEPAPPVRLPPVVPTSGRTVAPWPTAVATPRSNAPAALPGFAPAAARIEAGLPVARQIADSGMSAPIIVNDSGCSKISGINPLTIEATPGDLPEPKMSQLPGDNHLSGDATRVTDISDALESAAGDHREPARAQGVAQQFEAGGIGDVRQTAFLVRQPSGESNGLSAVDPLELSRTLSAPPAGPAAAQFQSLPQMATATIAGDKAPSGALPSQTAPPRSMRNNPNAYGAMSPGSVSGDSAGFRAANRIPLPSELARPAWSGPQGRPDSFSAAAAPTVAQAARTAGPSNAGQPVAGAANSAGNPLRSASRSNVPNVSTLVTNGIESPGDGAAGSQRNPLR